MVAIYRKYVSRRRYVISAIYLLYLAPAVYFGVLSAGLSRDLAAGELYPGWNSNPLQTATPVLLPLIHLSGAGFVTFFYFRALAGQMRKYRFAALAAFVLCITVVTTAVLMAGAGGL